MLHDREHLNLARRHLVDGEMRIARQKRIIADLRAGGHPTGLAEDLLASLLETLRQMQAHHDYLAANNHGG
jgi:hypothetical protein